MKIPNGFKLISLHLTNKGGLKVVWEEASKNNSLTDRDEMKRTSPVIPHPDLTKKLEDLDDYLADTYNMRPFLTVFKQNEDFTKKENDAIKDLKRITDKMHDFVMTQIDVTGFKISGEEASRSITINGTLIHCRSAISLNSPAVKFNQNKYGWEDDLDSRVDAISEEVLLYLFDNKAAQGDLFAEENGKKQLEDTKKEKVDDKKSKAEKEEKKKDDSKSEEETDFDAEPAKETVAAASTSESSEDF